FPSHWVPHPPLPPPRPDVVTLFPGPPPLPAAPAFFSPPPAGKRLLHACGHSRTGSDRDVRLHPSLPQGIAPLAVRRVHRPARAILVVAHVAISHDDGIDIGVNEFRIPAGRIGNAVDVVPPTGIETDKVRSQGRSNLHELETSFPLLDQHIGLDRPHRHAKVPLHGDEHIVPHGRLLGRLNLRQVQYHR